MTYTWSHSLDEETGLIPYLPQNSYNLHGEYGNSDFDVTNTFTAYASYDVPGSLHGPQWLSNGWQLHSLLSFHGGLPFSVTASRGTEPETGRAPIAPTRSATPLPESTTASSMAPCNGLIQLHLRDPALGTYGTSARGAYRNPGFSDVDFSVFKNTKIAERDNPGIPRGDVQPVQPD